MVENVSVARFVYILRYSSAHVLLPELSAYAQLSCSGTAASCIPPVVAYQDAVDRSAYSICGDNFLVGLETSRCLRLELMRGIESGVRGGVPILPQDA